MQTVFTLSYIFFSTLFKRPSLTLVFSQHVNNDVHYSLRATTDLDLIFLAGCVWIRKKPLQIQIPRWIADRIG